MRELARSSQILARPPEPQPPAPRQTGKVRRAERPVISNPWVTAPPRTPEIQESRFSTIAEGVGRQRLLAVGLLIVILALTIVLTSGQRFIDQPDPPILTDDADVRPLALPVNVRMTAAFSILGPRAPRAVPEHPRLQRYSYRSAMEVDAINENVYAITLRVTNRVWRGLRVGISERNAEGALALMGTQRTFVDLLNVPPRSVGKYKVFPSLDQRPRKTIGVEVRPPNGCYDVMVDLPPRAAGILIDGDRRYAVIGGGNAPLEWVVTQVRIVSRRMRGPYAEGVAC